MTTYYIRQDGSGDFTRVDTALKAGANGDTFIVDDNNTYSSEDWNDASIEAKDNYTIRAGTGKTPKINFASGQHLKMAGALGWLIQNLTFEPVQYFLRMGLGSSGLTLQNCIIKSSNSDGAALIYNDYGSLTLTIDGCTLYTTNAGISSGYKLFQFAISGTTATVKNSTIYGFQQVCSVSSTISSGIVFEKNRIYNCDRCNTQGGYIVDLYGAITLKNNYIYNCGNSGATQTHYGIYHASASSRLYSYNNSFYNVCTVHASSKTVGGSSYTAQEIKNTVFHTCNSIGFLGTSHSNNIIYGGSYTGNAGANLLTTDPNYTNPASGNLDILAISPAKNSGLTIASVTEDIYSTIRPQESNYDRGGHEIIAASGKAGIFANNL